MVRGFAHEIKDYVSQSDLAGTEEGKQVYCALFAAPMFKLSPQWPFNPQRSPVFYGWVIWLFSTLGVLASIPGQTMGMAVFTDPLIDALGLSRTQLSMAYLVGTVGSSVFLTRAGRWYDRYGARMMISGASAALGLFVAYIGFADQLAGMLGGGALVSFCLITAGYFGVRFFGQGVLTSSARNVLLVWFIKRRGLVNGIRSIFISAGFALAPVLLGWMISYFGWRMALWVLAVVVGGGFFLLSLVFIRDNPQSCGLLPDNENPNDASARSASDEPSKTRRQAQRSPVFWLYSLSLGMHALFGTALTFHIVSIFAEAGRSASEAFAYFLPAAVASTVTNLLVSTVVDRLPLKPFLIAMLALFIGGGWGLLHLESTWGYWLLVTSFGAGGGLWGVISSLTFVRFFGPLHLGEVSGLNASLTVFASAVGPAAFSVGLDYFGSYSAAIQVCLALLCLLLIAAISLRQEELAHEPRR